MAYELFERITEDTEKCTICGAVNTQDIQEIPSMYAGVEVSQRCRKCGSTESVADPFKGTLLLTNALTGTKTIH